MVLLFPPVNNFRRFLIHQTCENFRQHYDLFTFSVGQGPFRRTVVCFKNQLLDPSKFSDNAATVNFESRKKSPVKSWRSERKIEPTHEIQTSSLAAASSTITKREKNISTNRAIKMGVEKPMSDARSPKTTSVDLYRPPALRNHSIDLLDGKSVNAITTSLDASSINASPIPTTTSISCNSSPIHANENSNFDKSLTSTCTSSRVPPHEPTAGAATTQLSAQLAATTPPQQRAQQQQQSTSRRERRPDRAVYVPRARRSQTTPPTTTTAATTSSATAITSEATPSSTGTTNSMTTTATTTESCNNATAAAVTATATSTAGSNNQPHQQQLPIASDTNAPVATATPTKIDEIVSNKSAAKKTKLLASKERKERCSKKSNTSNETKSPGKESISILEVSLNDNHHSKNTHVNCDNVQFQHKNKQDKQDTSENPINSPIQMSEASDVQLLPRDIIVANEMNVANSGDCELQHMEKPNLRIEDVATSDNNTRSASTKCDIEEQEFQRASKEINRSNRRIIKQTFVSDVLEIPEKIETAAVEECVKPKAASNLPTSSTDSTTEEEEEDNWENMFDESGECLDPKIMQELTASVGKVKIELPKMDYSAYLTKQSILNEEEFPHVLEVSNFPVEFKNQDLLMVFSQYKESGFDIKWVDDTHALAVFSSSRIAAEVLTMGHPFVVLKPLAEATVESRLKAKKCAASLQPYRQRPETCAALARRLVTGALGVRLKTAAAERENEKRVLREAKERKLLAAKQRDEAWES